MDKMFDTNTFTQNSRRRFGGTDTHDEKNPLSVHSLLPSNSSDPDTHDIDD